MPSLISKLFHKTHIPGVTDGLTQEQREAIVDLLNYAMFADNNIAISEDQFIADTESKMTWAPHIDFDIYEEQSIGFVRRAKDDQSYRGEFFDSVKRRLGDPKTKNKALDLCSQLCAVDGAITPKEAEALKMFRSALF
jgi:hypothetical protein